MECRRIVSLSRVEILKLFLVGLAELREVARVFFDIPCEINAPLREGILLVSGLRFGADQCGFSRDVLLMTLDGVVISIGKSLQRPAIIETYHCVDRASTSCPLG